MTETKPVSPLPSVDRVMHGPQAEVLCVAYGRSAVVDAVRAALAQLRAERTSKAKADGAADADKVLSLAAVSLAARATPALKPVINLTGTVLHTNLGRALLSEEAAERVAMVARSACNLEFDLGSGERGERDALVEELLIELTGAEAATVVNNNAAAVLLVLAALAEGREVVVSRGELIEIGGAFRIPDVMRSANVRLVEVGTTNRTHAKDYLEAIGPDTALLMKVHTSNYKIVGFTAEVAERELAEIAQRNKLPLAIDLGAGSLIDLEAFGLPKEPIVRDTLAAGVDIVTFSGDKLLGGPQAGLIVGKKDLIQRISRHPLKRALRVSKLTLAALEATLLAYRSPDFLRRDLPTLRLLTRAQDEIQALAERLKPHLAAALGDGWQVAVTSVASQVGSGSLPLDELPSAALALTPVSKSSAAPQRLLAALRALPTPIIGRVGDGSVILDLRCLEDEPLFLAQMQELARVKLKA